MRFWMLCAVVLASFSSPDVFAEEHAGPERRVLVVNLVEPELTQSHLGLTAFSTSERRIENDWAMGAYTGDALSKLLAAAGYESVPADTEGRPGKVLKNPMATWSGKPAFQKDFASWLQAAMSETGAAHAVVLQTFGRTWNPGTYAEFSGYGIGSAMGEPPRRAWVYANVRAVIVASSSTKALESPNHRDSDCRVAIDVETLPAGHFRDWTADALRPYEETLRSVVERRLRQDLAAAGLVAESVEPCRVTPV